MNPDWTKNAEGTSNSSPLYLRLVATVTQMIRDDGHNLLGGHAERTAGLILAKLVHVHGLAPACMMGWRAVTPELPPVGMLAVYLHRDCHHGWLGRRRADGGWQPVDVSKRPVPAEEVEAWMPIPTRGGPIVLEEEEVEGEVERIRAAHRSLEHGEAGMSAYISAHGDRGVLLRLIDRLVPKVARLKKIRRWIDFNSGAGAAERGISRERMAELIALADGSADAP